MGASVQENNIGGQHGLAWKRLAVRREWMLFVYEASMFVAPARIGLLGLRMAGQRQVLADQRCRRLWPRGERGWPYVVMKGVR